MKLFQYLWEGVSVMYEVPAAVYYVLYTEGVPEVNARVCSEGAELEKNGTNMFSE